MSKLQDLFEAKYPMPNGITRCGDHYSQTMFVLSGDAGDYCAKFDGFKEAWQEQQKRIDELQDQYVDFKEYIGLQEYLYQGDSYNRGWNSALIMIKEKLEKLINGDKK